MKRLTLVFLLVLTLVSATVAVAKFDPGDPGFPPDAAVHK